MESGSTRPWSLNNRFLRPLFLHHKTDHDVDITDTRKKLFLAKLCLMLVVLCHELWPSGPAHSIR